MTPEAIEELRRLEREASPGPWKWESESGRIPQGSYLGETLITLGDRYENCDADCVLLAAARNALPALLDAATLLESERTIRLALEDALGKAERERDEAQQALFQANEELERIGR